MVEEERGAATVAGMDVVEALRVWRDGLINLTGTNRALNFKHSKTGTVAIDAPGLPEILEGLRAGKTWALDGIPDERGMKSGE